MNGGNRHDEVMKRMRNGETGKGREVFKADTQYPGERRNAIVISLIKELDFDLSSHHEVGPGSGYDEEKGKNGGEAGASNSPVQNLCQGKGLDTEKPQPSSSRKKVEALEVSDMGKTEETNRRKRELDRYCTKRETAKSQGLSLGNPRDILSTGDEFEKVVKVAWVTKE